MTDAQEMFNLTPRVTNSSSRDDLISHILDCHKKMLALFEAFDESIEELKDFNRR